MADTEAAAALQSPTQPGFHFLTAASLRLSPKAADCLTRLSSVSSRPYCLSNLERGCSLPETCVVHTLILSRFVLFLSPNKTCPQDGKFRFGRHCYTAAYFPMPHFHCQIGMRVMERRGCCHFVDPVGHRIFFPSNAWCLLNVVRKEENTMVLIWEGYKLEEGPESRQKIAEHVEVRAPSQANSLSISLIHTSAA